MRRKYVESTSVIFWLFIIFHIIPLALSCIYLLNGWMPMSVYNRTAFADVVISANVIRTFKAQEFRTAAQTYTAEVNILEVYKGKKLFRQIPVTVKDSKVYNISNFGDRKMCYADVMEGDSYIFFLTIYQDRLSAKYDDIFGAVTKFTEYNIREVLDQVGSGLEDWTPWSACSQSCGGGYQTRQRRCKHTSVDCIEESVDRRECNTFVCKGVHNMLSYLGVYKLPLGVTNIPSRHLSFNITDSAILFSPLISIYPKGFPDDFSLLMTLKFHNNYSGYFFTLSDLMGKQRFALLYSRGSLSVQYFDQNNVFEEKSTEFDVDLSDNNWHQVSLSVSGNQIELYSDCDTVIVKDFRRTKYFLLGANLMLSLGPYFARYGEPFVGGIEQLSITDDPVAASQQCSTETEETDYTERAVKDEEHRQNDSQVDEEQEHTNIPQNLEEHLTSPEWSEWTSCSTTCGRGTQRRQLICTNDVINNCIEANVQKEDVRFCFIKSCKSTCQGQCKNGGRCTSTGICLCPKGFQGDRCETTVCEPNCSNGGKCISPGVCVCPVGFDGPTCENAVCEPKCRNGGRCIRPGYCSCPYGYLPPRCKPVCTLPCRNGGRCIRPEKCKCTRGYSGRDCSRPLCRRGCHNGGKCVAPNTCTCPSGYGGSKCHQAVCFPECQNSGKCLYPGVCRCKKGYSGELCQNFCKKACQNGGSCAGRNHCACPFGYRGRWCHKVVKRKLCHRKCLNGGKCRGRRCICKDGFAGTRCEKRKCDYQTYMMPYQRTYRKLEREEYLSSCGSWGWDSCTKTRDYQRYFSLNEAETDALLALTLLLSPDKLNGKVIFQDDAMCGNNSNNFLELSAVQNNLLLTDSILVGGQRRTVRKIMAYKQQWFLKNWYYPMTTFIRRLGNLAEGPGGNRQLPAAGPATAYPTFPQPRSTSSKSSGSCFCTII